MSSLHRMLKSFAIIACLAICSPMMAYAQDAASHVEAPPAAADSHAAEAESHAHQDGHGDDHATADHSSDGHGDGHAYPGVPGDLALWSGVAFVLFALVVWKLNVLNGIANALFSSVSGHEQRELAALKNAELLTSEANEILRKNRGRVEALDETVRATLDEAGRDAAHTTDEILGSARTEAEAINNRARLEIERSRDQSLNDIFDTLATKVMESTERRLRQQLGSGDQDRLIDETLTQWSGSVSR